MRIVSKIIVIFFLLWHMFAVFFYAIPRDANDIFSQWTRLDILPIISPYILQTSQWQLWNIFSPDPLRQVTAYRIEVQENNEWNELLTIDADTYSIFRKPIYTKLMLNTLDDSKGNQATIAGRFLHLVCHDKKLIADTPIRLLYMMYTIPYITKPQTSLWWRQWQPEYYTRLGFTTTCP
jgi:hypothetical protein